MREKFSITQDMFGSSRKLMVKYTMSVHLVHYHLAG